MNPPTGVRVTTALMYLSIVAGLIVLFTQPAPPMPNGVPAGFVGMIHGLAIAFALVEAVIVYFYLKGHGWARWLVILDSLLQVLLLLRIGKAWSMSHVSASLVIANGVLAIGLLVYLFSAEAMAYFSPKPVAA